MQFKPWHWGASARIHSVVLCNSSVKPNTREREKFNLKTEELLCPSEERAVYLSFTILASLWIIFFSVFLQNREEAITSRVKSPYSDAQSFRHVIYTQKTPHTFRAHLNRERRAKTATHTKHFVRKTTTPHIHSHSLMPYFHPFSLAAAAGGVGVHHEMVAAALHSGSSSPANSAASSSSSSVSSSSSMNGILMGSDERSSSGGGGSNSMSMNVGGGGGNSGTGGHSDQPFFDDISPRNVTSAVDDTVQLKCRVKNKGNRTVSWSLNLFFT